jgi:hypothetical protein
MIISRLRSSMNFFFDVRYQKSRGGDFLTFFSMCLFLREDVGVKTENMTMLTFVFYFPLPPLPTTTTTTTTTPPSPVSRVYVLN